MSTKQGVSTAYSALLIFHVCHCSVLQVRSSFVINLTDSVNHLEDDSTAESSPIQSHLDEAPAAQDR